MNQSRTSLVAFLGVFSLISFLTSWKVIWYKVERQGMYVKTVIVKNTGGVIHNMDELHILTGWLVMTAMFLSGIDV